MAAQATADAMKRSKGMLTSFPGLSNGLNEFEATIRVVNARRSNVQRLKALGHLQNNTRLEDAKN